MSVLRFRAYCIIWVAIGIFIVWLGEHLIQNQKMLLKVIGGLLWLLGVILVGTMLYKTFGRLAWRTNALKFLRPFFPPQ